MKTKLSIGFSPCPNDTFIFDALVNGKIDTGDFIFEPVLEDVQTLNQWAIEGKLDVTKISYAVLPLVIKDYDLLSAGGALGKGVGPLLIAPKDYESKSLVEDQLIALPGENTTAHLLFSLAYPKAKNKIFLKYNEIEDFVLQGKGLGVIIHENRFTYSEKGLIKIVDLGDYWEQQTGAPIPLGCIIANKKLDTSTQRKLNALIKESLAYSYQQQPDLSDYIKEHAQEMEEKVMQQHINLYVNNFTEELGDLGLKAVQALVSVYSQQHPKTNFCFENINLRT